MNPNAKPGDVLDIVYVTDSPLGALFAAREVAQCAAQIWRAVYESNTWGEFLAALPAPYREQVIDLLGEELPAKDTPFSSDDAPGWEGDGNFLGPWPPQAVLKWFPEDLIDEYGGKVEPNPNGENLELPADAGDRIAEELRARGHRVEKTPSGDLATWLHYAYGG